MATTRVIHTLTLAFPSPNPSLDRGIPRWSLQAHMEGAAFLTKADTMARADRSSLTSKPGAIYGERPR